MEIAVILTFIIGYAAIVFEHPLKLDKTVPALIMAALCWAIIALWHLPVYDHHHELIDVNDSLLHHLGKTSEILMFLIGAMTIVELVDLHKGFSVITDNIKTNKKSTMAWLVCILSFFLSALLDNLTCAIVMVSLLRKLVPNREERIVFVSLVVITANAGGAWSPIGDVTTTMLWIGDKVSTTGLLVSLVIPSIICAVVPTFILTLMPYMKGNLSAGDVDTTVEDKHHNKEVKGSKLMLIAGVLGLLFVPVFKTVTHLPPYMGMILSLGVVWLISEYLHPDENFEDKHHYSAHNALSRIEMSSILFFLGILLAVTALESLGTLAGAAAWMDNAIPDPSGNDRVIVMSILGLGSALIDNVPIVAAAMGMYTEPLDSKLWHFLAYAAGTGGSMLIIGSAAGVAAMGMEKIDFMWYLRKMAWLALVGFLAGAATFLLMYPLVEGVFH